MLAGTGCLKTGHASKQLVEVLIILVQNPYRMNGCHWNTCKLVFTTTRTRVHRTRTCVNANAALLQAVDHSFTTDHYRQCKHIDITVTSLASTNKAVQNALLYTVTQNFTPHKATSNYQFIKNISDSLAV